MHNRQLVAGGDGNYKCEPAEGGKVNNRRGTEEDQRVIVIANNGA